VGEAMILGGFKGDEAPLLNLIPPLQEWRRTEHHGKLHVLISAEIREHKLAGQTLLLA